MGHYNKADKTIIISTPSFVNYSNNRRGSQPRGNIGYQSYGNKNNGSRPSLSNIQRPRQSMYTHDTTE